MIILDLNNEMSDSTVVTLTLPLRHAPKELVAHAIWETGTGESGIGVLPGPQIIRSCGKADQES